MGVERDEVSTEVGRVVKTEGFLTRKSSRAYRPPAMERVCRGPWVDGANCKIQFVESGGRLRDRRCSLVVRLVATKGSRS